VPSSQLKIGAFAGDGASCPGSPRKPQSAGLQIGFVSNCRDISSYNNKINVTKRCLYFLRFTYLLTQAGDRMEMASQRLSREFRKFCVDSRGLLLKEQEDESE
jgi:hypothetical protein